MAAHLSQHDFYTKASPALVAISQALHLFVACLLHSTTFYTKAQLFCLSTGFVARPLSLRRARGHIPRVGQVLEVFLQKAAGRPLIGERLHILVRLLVPVYDGAWASSLPRFSDRLMSKEPTMGNEKKVFLSKLVPYRTCCDSMITHLYCTQDNMITHPRDERKMCYIRILKLFFSIILGESAIKNAQQDAST